MFLEPYAHIFISIRKNELLSEYIFRFNFLQILYIGELEVYENTATKCFYTYEQYSGSQFLVFSCSLSICVMSYGIMFGEMLHSIVESGVKSAFL